MQLPAARTLYPRSISGIRVYITSVLLLVLAEISILLLPPLGLGVFSLVVPLLVTGVIFRRRPIKTNSVRVVLLVTMACGMLTYIVNRFAVLGATVENISVNDAPLNGDAAVYTFSDAEVRTDIIGESVQTLRGNTRLYYDVHPLVPIDWRTGDVIPAWVDANSLTEGWETWRGGTRLIEPYFYTAVRQAQLDYGFNVADGAPVLRWEAEPGLARSTQNNQILLIFAAGLLILTLGLGWTETHSSSNWGSKPQKPRRTPFF